MTLTNLSRRVGPHYPATEAVRDIYLRSIKPYRGRLTLVDEDRSPIRGVKLISSPGHSPGHSSVRFQGKGEALLVSGDSWITKPDQLENPEWEFFIELDAAQAYNSRIRVLSAAARRRELMLSYHEAFPGLGYVSVNGAAFSWTPAQAQTELMGTGVATQC
ncbi:unnamed protein product [Chondrus crispus]|uniref:Metallo-beta-lactamase domain-containing protein n=1 Tax=Chondrus crispus TaxID=2769 RepID=R7QNG6_CHOCR|nr:unnamed protein product [Chondrus crispus]CDF40032.1 unnamed protein product [Chondrus crispus]|eukprot:XP_005710326.1 unnamed protein product [Chondrus crispus]